jgi:hypothetical protein
MATSAFRGHEAAPALVIRPVRDALIITATVIIVLIALYAIYLDQGQLLSPAMGKVAETANYIHEFAHDGRHLFGAPCH